MQIFIAEHGSWSSHASSATASRWCSWGYNQGAPSAPAEGSATRANGLGTAGRRLRSWPTRARSYPTTKPVRFTELLIQRQGKERIERARSCGSGLDLFFDDQQRARACSVASECPRWSRPTRKPEGTKGVTLDGFHRAPGRASPQEHPGSLHARRGGFAVTVYCFPCLGRDFHIRRQAAIELTVEGLQHDDAESGASSGHA